MARENTNSPYGHAEGKMVGGVWVTNLPNRFYLKLAIGFATADAATLFTFPSDKIVVLERLWWEVVTGFTGGSSSAIGVSSDATGYSTKGDLLGGASGDVTATLGTSATYKGGTVGAKYASNGIVIIPAGKVLRFDAITSAYTVGAGFVHVLGSVIN